MKSRFLRVGRGETNSQNQKNDIQINHPTVSRSHLEVFIDEENNVFITDMQTRNGTFVNGNPIVGDHKLSYGDILKLGSARPVQWKNWIDGNYETEQNLMSEQSGSSKYNSSEYTTLNNNKRFNSGVIAILVSLFFIFFLLALMAYFNKNSKVKNNSSVGTIDKNYHHYSKNEMGLKTFDELVDLAIQNVFVSDINDGDFISTIDDKLVLLNIIDKHLINVILYDANQTQKVNNDKKETINAFIDSTSPVFDNYTDSVVSGYNIDTISITPKNISTIYQNGDGTFSMLTNEGLESVDHFIDRIKQNKQDCQYPSTGWEIISLNNNVLNENQRTNAVLPANHWIKFKCY